MLQNVTNVTWVLLIYQALTQTPPLPPKWRLCKMRIEGRMDSRLRGNDGMGSGNDPAKAGQAHRNDNGGVYSILPHQENLSGARRYEGAF
jgi:hypothetical protein